MKTIEDSIEEIGMNTNYIVILLFVIMLQGCFGCNNGNQQVQKIDKQITEFNFKEWWNEFKYK